uniref:Uncharacterized protein n=1 Tax=Triticum urartu TaxID=4572 RepID=A0A8R7V882_TRIUA
MQQHSGGQRAVPCSLDGTLASGSDDAPELLFPPGHERMSVVLQFSPCADAAQTASRKLTVHWWFACSTPPVTKNDAAQKVQ